MEFEAFYEDVHQRLVASLVAFCGDADVGQDAVDEAIVRAYERWHTVRAMSSPAAWVFRTGFNVARRIHGRRRRLIRLLPRLHVDPTVPGPAGEVWRLVAELPRRQRQVIVLRHVADLTEPDIAAALGLTRGTVSSTLRTAHASLRAQLAGSTVAKEVGP